MEEKQLNEKESLELITRMIKNTQNRLERSAGMPFLVWGYVTFLVSLAVWYALKTTGNHYWNFLWLAIPVIGWPLMMLSYRKNPTGIKTYIDRIILNIWIVLGIAAFFYCVQYTGIITTEYRKLPVLFCIAMTMGIGTIITGLIIKFRPCIVAGIVGILLSQFCLTRSLDAVLYFGMIFMVMMIIPGHILNYRANHDNV